MIIGGIVENELPIAMVGRNAEVPAGIHIMPGGTIGTDVVMSDYSSQVIKPGEYIQTRRLPNEI